MEITRQLRCHAIFVAQRCPDGETVAKDMRAAAAEIERLQAELDDAAEGATAAGAIIKARDAKIERLQGLLPGKEDHA